MRILFAAIAISIYYVSTILAAQSREVPQHPNIVIILADDLGYGSVGCYGAPPSLVRTPNIDRLAREGRRFTDANTPSSVCTPTRYALLTGRYCWRTWLKHEVAGVFSPLLIEPERLNLASMLKKHGYETAAIGKWHLGYGTGPRTDYTKELRPGPLEIGFDYHFAVPSNHGDVTGVYVENHWVFGLRSDRLNPAGVGKNFNGKPYLGLDAPQRVDEEVMPTLTAKAVQWIEERSGDKPFFLYFTPVAVHRPITPSRETRGTSAVGPYGDWIHELDLSVGRVLEALDRKGFTANTLVIFTSDNGGVNKPTLPSDETNAAKAGLAICGPFRGGKHDVWEGGFRVPFIVRWPGHVPAGTVCNEMMSLTDVLATVAAIVGEDLPPPHVAAEDSYNMLPAWLDQPYVSPIRPDMIVHSADGNFAIRRGPWKWIEGTYHPDTRPGALRLRADQFHPQLYNLREDIGETKDVASEHPEIVKELSQLLDLYRDRGYSRGLAIPAAR
ncbi:arylsulfatase [Thermogutta sp.]|uniref:sulfatase family protein n=1 Tax=Thermogutta sp. TaxID=1962930 RepID=UPI00321FC0F4